MAQYFCGMAESATGSGKRFGGGMVAGRGIAEGNSPGLFLDAKVSPWVRKGLQRKSHSKPHCGL
jgi:hypothetical protein